MPKIYRNLIMKKAITIDDVHEKYKKATLKLLNDVGLDGYGQPLI